MISYAEAYRLTLENIQRLDAVEIPLTEAVGRYAARDLTGLADTPSVDASLKDGFAVHSSDIAEATVDAPVTLRVIGTVAAGGDSSYRVRPGEAVRILSGAPVPDGADAVVAEEFTEWLGDQIRVTNNAHRGRNILPRSSDVRLGDKLVDDGQQLHPTVIGLLAAAGYSRIPVVRQPGVAILATGDEVIAPGEPLQPGKLYASNLVTLAGWCAKYQYPFKTFVAPDREDIIRDRLVSSLRDYDVVLTSGGAWSGERDLTVRLLDELGWQKIYHRVRLGPGKAVGFGICRGTPVFCLPGGPPSNHMAFLQLALPGVQKLSGAPGTGLPRRMVRLAESVRGQIDWTQFIHGRLEDTGEFPLFYPLNPPSRLQMISETEAMIQIPEGQTIIEKGQVVEGQILI